MWLVIWVGVMWVVWSESVAVGVVVAALILFRGYRPGVPLSVRLEGLRDVRAERGDVR